MTVKFPPIFTVGDYLRDDRRRLRLGQKEAANKCGYSLRMWQYWEYGEKIPSKRALRDLAKVFPAVSVCISA